VKQKHFCLNSFHIVYISQNKSTNTKHKFIAAAFMGHALGWKKKKFEKIGAF
jgi:hypothetical protein